MFVCERAQPRQVRRAQERIRRELREEREDRRAPRRCLGLALEDNFELVDVPVEAVPEEVAPWTPLFQDFERVGVREAAFRVSTSLP